MDKTQAVAELIEPLLRPLGVELWDIDHTGGVLRVAVDRAGGIDLDTIAEVTRTVSRALDSADPIPGRYSLEVTSPGVERTLRTPEHFTRSLGSEVKVKTIHGYEGPRRMEGTLEAADAAGVALRVTGGDADAAALAAGPGPVVRLAYGDIERARTVFVWEPAERSSERGRKGPVSKHRHAGRRPAGRDRKAAS